MSSSLKAEYLADVFGDDKEKDYAKKVVNRIASAVTTIAPKAGQTRRCWEDVHDALIDLGIYDLGSEAKTRALRRDSFRKSIVRVRNELDRVKSAVKRVPVRAHAWGLTRMLDVRRQIDLCDRLLADYPPAEQHRDASGKMRAALSAHQLLKRYEHKPTTSRAGKFCKLAAVLFGDPDANLQHQCRDVISSAKLDQQS